jgi:cytochrome c biogenesis protein CcmG/thiol:disulfide interchange protein DsbE
VVVGLFAVAAAAGVLALHRGFRVVRPETRAGVASVSVGAFAPRFRGPAVWGGRVDLSQFRGEPVVLNFWSSWSPYCRRETPYLIAAADALDSKVAFLSVDVDEPPTAGIDYVVQAGIPYPVVLDPRGTLARRYGVRVLPTTLFIAASGRIAMVYPGAFTSTRAVESAIRHVLLPPPRRSAPARHRPTVRQVR